MNRLECLQYLARRCRAHVYLEIGVRSGTTFFKLPVRSKIGVDPVSVGRRARIASLLDYPGNVRARFFAETSDMFFATHAPQLFARRGIDLAFIDGKHTYDQTLRDIINTLTFLSPQGVIVVHDANPETEAHAWPAESPEDAFRARTDCSSEGWCGEVWKAIVHVRAARPDVGLLTLADDYGLAVLNPRLAVAPIGVSEEDVRTLSYDEFDRHRTAWLQLGTPADLEAWVGLDPAIRR